MTHKPRTLIAAAALASAVATGAFAPAAQADTLEVNIAFKGASQRAVWTQVIDEFKKSHPGTNVKVAFDDEEVYGGYLGGKLRGKVVACPGRNASIAKTCC